ncbi:hypothetical protein PWT90_10126 [Aphanocladium album]|nr:hypothetical protein PWT90_10126 [Aphanocladium album]
MAQMSDTTAEDQQLADTSDSPSHAALSQHHDTEKSIEEDRSINYPGGFPLAMILTSVTLANFLFFLDLAVISTATPAISSQFDSLIDIGCQFSIKWTFAVFFLIFEIGSAICGAAQSSPMFIVGRVIAGIGSAGIANGSVTTISNILPVKKQALFMGLNMGIGQLGLATGPIIGGVFTTKASWRWCFYVNLPLGVIVGAFILFNQIPEPKAKGPPLKILGSAIGSLDLPGFMLICPAVIMFLLGLQFGGNQYPWNSSVVIGLLVGAAVTFVLFLVWEQRQGDAAMVPFAMLKHKVIWSTAMTMFFSLSSILVADFYIAIYFQAIHDDSALMSGVHMLPVTLGLVLFTMISGTLISIMGYYLPFLLIGGAVSAVGYGLLSTLSISTSTGQWIGYQILYGVAGGCMTAAPYIAIQSLVPAEQIPTAMAIIIFWQNIGGAVSLIAANAIFSNSLQHELQLRFGEIGISPDKIVGAGVRSIRDLVAGPQLAAVLTAYARSIDKVMYLGISVSCGVLIFCSGLGWKDIRKINKLQAINESTSK